MPAASPRRDAMFLLLGTLLGIPAGLFTNYVYDALFPNSVSVSVDGTGVKDVAIPVASFGITRAASPDQRDGTINVIYGQGTDTRDFNCSATVKNGKFLERYAFDPGCRRLTFRVKARAELEKLSVASPYETVVFAMSIVSKSKGAWEGDATIFVWLP